MYYKTDNGFGEIVSSEDTLPKNIEKIESSEFSKFKEDKKLSTIREYEEKLIEFEEYQTKILKNRIEKLKN